MPKEFIVINGTDFMFKGKRFEDDEGHPLPALYGSETRFLKQEYIYEDGDGKTISIDTNHPSQD